MDSAPEWHSHYLLLATAAGVPGIWCVGSNHGAIDCEAKMRLV